MPADPNSITLKLTNSMAAALTSLEESQADSRHFLLLVAAALGVEALMAHPEQYAAVASKVRAAQAAEDRRRRGRRSKVAPPASLPSAESSASPRSVRFNPPQ